MSNEFTDVLKVNLENTMERIQAACERAGRDPKEVTLIAVSKTKPAEMIEACLELGQIDFGENYPQELKEKIAILPDTVRWHMIGHLQRNKVKYIAEKAAMIHSVDSLELAKTIQKEAIKHDRVIDVLIEVNVAEEESKSGVRTDEVLPLVREIAALDHVHICGLMTIAPFVDDPEENRPVFRTLRQLSVDIAKENIDNISMSALSMGMTNDYEVAIKEGATMVRIGTGIFGARDYSNK